MKKVMMASQILTMIQTRMENIQPLKNDKNLEIHCRLSANEISGESSVTNKIINQPLAQVKAKGGKMPQTS